MNGKPIAAGKSSFDLIDKNKVFSVLDVKPTSSFIDLACGAGNYSIELAKIIGDKGIVYAVDLWEEGIDTINTTLNEAHLTNIKTIVADITKKLPLETNSFESCLLATILHDLSGDDQIAVLQEATRILKPGGMLNIIEFKNIDNGPGPPKKIRISEEEIETIVSNYGYTKVYIGEAGPFNYIAKFKKSRF